MSIELLIPEAQEIATAEDVLRLLAERSTQPVPFADETIDFCARFSQAVFRDREAARFPELVALAFWMRKAELLRSREEFRKGVPPETLALPRGVVFHIPPGNVDTIFVYSWLLSALAGNRNVIRMSSRRTAQVDILLRLWRETLETVPAMRSNTVVLSYGHDAQITQALSLHCDVRVIWGGDATVSQIRAIPLPPHAREVAFPDRSSLSVLAAEPYLELNDEERAKLAASFFNDAYWFDQMACSSPRTVVWCGGAGPVKQAAERFWNALAECIAKKGYESAPAVQMRKFVFACEAAIDGHASGYWRDRDTTVLTLDSADFQARENCGGGFFFSARVDELTDLIPALRRKDQTLGYFGFTADELRAFALSLGGKAIDRIVPIGQALQFNRFWDGHDLLHEFCRFTFLA